MNIRYSIGQLLEYLWQVPGHAAAWRALAAAQVRPIAVMLPLRMHALMLSAVATVRRLLPAFREHADQRRDLPGTAWLHSPSGRESC